MSLADMIKAAGSGGSESPGRHLYGAVIGVVTDNVHPEGEYRCKVKFPQLPGTDTSWWCRITTWGASKDGAGLFILPEVDDEVLVVFNNGDVNQGIIIGTLWNGIDKPAFSNKDAKSSTKRYQDNDAKFKGKTEAKKNDIRGISTRKGHELVFNDNANDPMVVLSSGKKHRIVLDDKGGEPNKIEIYDGKEENYILIDTKNKKITIETKTGDLVLKAKKKIILDCEDFENKASKSSKAESGTTTEMKVGSNFKMNASGTAEIKSSGKMTIQGATVHIN